MGVGIDLVALLSSMARGGSGWFIYDIPYAHEDFDMQVQILRNYYRTL